MMTQQFTKDELWAVRNKISVRSVIQTLLDIPGKEVEGMYRFLCPVCKESQTGIHQKTNLSRCFRCNRNFNTIDLVMLVRKIGFVPSIKLLQDYARQSAQRSRNQTPPRPLARRGGTPQPLSSLIKANLEQLASRGKQSPAFPGHQMCRWTIPTAIETVAQMDC